MIIIIIIIIGTDNDSYNGNNNTVTQGRLSTEQPVDGIVQRLSTWCVEYILFQPPNGLLQDC